MCVVDAIVTFTYTKKTSHTHTLTKHNTPTHPQTQITGLCGRIRGSEGRGRAARAGGVAPRLAPWLAGAAAGASVGRTCIYLYIRTYI